jgi:hypothetical protein
MLVPKAVRGVKEPFSGNSPAPIAQKAAHFLGRQPTAQPTTVDRGL